MKKLFGKLYVHNGEFYELIRGGCGVCHFHRETDDGCLLDKSACGCGGYTKIKIPGLSYNDHYMEVSPLPSLTPYLKDGEVVELPTAENAKLLTMEYLQKEHNRQLMIIRQCIISSAGCGQHSIVIDEDIPQVLMDDLINKGFDVKSVDGVEKSGIMISW